jgi:hypothetical protein
LLLISFEFPYLRSSLLLVGLTSEWYGRVGVVGGIVLGTGKNIDVPTSIQGDAGDLICMTTLLEGELAEAHRSREVAEERFRRLMNSSFEGAWRLVASKAG